MLSDHPDTERQTWADHMIKPGTSIDSFSSGHTIGSIFSEFSDCKLDEDENNDAPFHSKYIKQSTESATLLINEQSRLMEESGNTVHKFGFGQSPFLPPDYVMKELSERSHHKEYISVQGLKELREKVSSFYKRVDGTSFEARNVIIGTGSKLLIYAILKSFKDANVFLVTPSWVSYEPQCELNGLHVIRIQTTAESRWRLTPELLRRAHADNLASGGNPDKPGILILNYPGNPDGLTFSPQELAELARVFEQLSLLVISDEIYGLLHHQGQHQSIALHYPQGTIVTGGLSKWCGAGGWRLGVCLLPTSMEHSLKPSIIGILSETVSCAPAPVQYAALKAYDYTLALDSYLAHQRRILAALAAFVYGQLADSGYHVHMPSGGFYMYPDLTAKAAALAERGLYSSKDLSEDLLKSATVAVLPGSAFGAPDDRFTFRLSYVDFDGDAALKASQALGLETPIDLAFLERFCPKVLSGARLLAAYADKL